MAEGDWGVGFLFGWGMVVYIFLLGVFLGGLCKWTLRVPVTEGGGPGVGGGLRWAAEANCRPQSIMQMYIYIYIM